MASHSNKRSRPLESDEEQINAFERFIVVKSKDQEKPLKSLSVFIIEKSLEGSIGHPKSVKFLGSGDLLVETASEKQTNGLLKCTHLFGVEIEATPHKSLNSSKGIIRDPNLKNSSIEEITENLKSQGVSYVRRVSIKRQGSTIQTNTYIVTFNRPKPPTSLKIFYSSVKVDTYIPNPLRCFHCQKFGHHENNCRNTPICHKCGQGASHHPDNCTNPVKCANCGKDHVASSNLCDIWKKEKEIIKIKTLQNKSYPEAKKLYEQLVNPLKSYASIVTKPQTAEKGVQTDDKSTQTECPKETITISDKPKSNVPHHERKTIVNTSIEKKQPKSGRAPKGSKDPINLYNKFGALEEMDLAVVNDRPPADPDPSGKSIPPITYP